MEKLTEPLTIEKIKQIKDEHNYIEGTIAMSLSDIIDNDFEGFLDLISEKLTDSPLLMSASYKVVGHQDEYTILLQVSGDATAIIDGAEEDEENDEEEEDEEV